MANKKISELTALTSPDNADELAIVDTSVTTTKKITWANLLAAVGLSAYFKKDTDTLDNINAGTTNKHFTSTLETKLSGIEASADVTDATNVASAGAVMNTGNETIAGIKTFSSSPIVPAPTTDLQVATKKYVDDNAGGSGDVVGPVSSTDNAVARFDGTTGKLLQDTSVVTISDAGNIVTPANVLLSGTLQLDGHIMTRIGGDYVIYITRTDDAVNYIGIKNNSTTNAPEVQAGGSDTNVNLNLVPKGTGVVQAGGVEVTTISGTQTLTNKTLTSPKLNEDVAVTAKATEVNVLAGIPATLTATELGYVDGVTSAIQTQLNAKAPTASPTFTGTVTLPTGLTGVLRADSGVVSTDTNVTDLVTAADTDTAGKVELATTAETTTGEDLNRAVTPIGLSQSVYGKRVAQIQVSDPAGDAITTGDGKAYFCVPSELNGYNLVDADAFVTTVSSSGAPSVQIHNLTDTQDMLSTNITIDANEKTSYTAATASAINASYDDVATGDILRIDIDGAGTGAKGLGVILSFQKPQPID